MKNLFKSILAASVLLFAASCSNSFSVSGDISGLEDGNVYLSREDSTGMMAPVDTVKSTGGKFQIQGEVKDGPEFVVLSFEKAPEVQIPLYLDNSKVTVKGEVSKAEDVVIEGSKSHDFFKKLLNEEKAVAEQIESKREGWMTAMQSGDQAALAEIEKSARSIQEEGVKNIAKILKEDPDQVITVYYLSRYAGMMDFAELKEIYSKVGDKIKKSDKSKSFDEYYQKLEKISAGSQAPDFSLKSVADTAVVVSNASLAGKPYALFVTVANFPANEEVFAALKSVKAEKPEMEVVDVFLTYPGQEGEVAAYTQTMGVNEWTNLAGEQSFAETFVVSAPTVFFVDKDGKIVASTTEKDAIATIVKEKM